MEKDSYKVLGINENALNYISLLGTEGKFERKSRKVEDKDIYVEEVYKDKKDNTKVKYEEKIKILKQNYDRSIGAKKLLCKIKNSGTKVKVEKQIEEEIKEYEEEKNKLIREYKKSIKEIDNAYEKIKTEGLRKIYSVEKPKNSEIKKERILLKDTAYDFFNLSETKIYTLSDNEADKKIKEVFNKKIEQYEELLEDNIDNKEKQKIQYLKIKAKRNYESISTSKKRKLYKEILNKKEQEKEREMQEKIIKKKYSKADQYDPNLIKTISNGRAKGKKLVIIKKLDNPTTIKLKGDRNLKLKKSAVLAFRNATGVYDSYLYEYKVLRNVNGKEQIDRIYTDISIQKLSIDQKKGEPIDKEYYNCITNDLLSEETIRGSKYNGGYIGLVEKEQNKEYKITLKDKKLNAIEQENLAAVMILQERREKKIKSKNKEKGAR